jgi:ubiquitin-protein ligase
MIMMMTLIQIIITIIYLLTADNREEAKYEDSARTRREEQEQIRTRVKP